MERVLARAFPLVDHGGERGSLAVLAEVRAFAADPWAAQNPQSEAAARLVLHHLAWPVAGYALACDRVDLVAELGAVVVASRYGDGDGTVFESSDVRHSDVFGRSADRTYDDLCEWLSGTALRAVVPRLRREQDLDGALAEAELVAGLRFATRWADRSYCHVIGRGGEAERRLRAHLRSTAGRVALARLVGCDPKDLVETINELYGRLAGVQGWGPDGPLITSR